MTTTNTKPRAKAKKITGVRDRRVRRVEREYVVTSGPLRGWKFLHGCRLEKLHRADAFVSYVRMECRSVTFAADGFGYVSDLRNGPALAVNDAPIHFSELREGR